jgi:3-isopropylmalate/(R)-2-methylmalate dehydratase large subunit
MAMTIVEKILARASGAASVAAGDFAIVNVDVAVLSDMTFEMFTHEMLAVWDASRVVVVFDHYVPAASKRSAAAQQLGRAFVKRFGIERFHDVGSDQGIAHNIVAEHAYALPGTLLVGGDSHTCAGGALNCAARGVGGPEMLYAVTTGTTWFQVGSTVRYDLEGTLSPGVAPKDLFLHIAGTYGDHTNQNVEFGGSGLAGLRMNARATLATMGAELSAEFVVFEADDKLLAYVSERTTAAFEPQYPDADAMYAARRTIDLGSIRPLVALPDAVIRNSVPIGDIAGQRIDQAFIGSCANGTLDDLAEAARVVAGKHVAPGVRFVVTPSTQAIFRDALRAGYVQTLMEAGAVVTPATCGACSGGHMGVLGENEVCITASTRNFKGRMGAASAKIFMASPATVAAAAIAGYITEAAEVVA